MGKTAIVVTRLLDVALIMLVVGVVGTAAFHLEEVGDGAVPIMAPAHFAPAEQLLEVRNNVVGTGFIGDAKGVVVFKAPLASLPTFLYALTLVFNFAAAFILVVILRRIAATVVAGDPFAEANINRIRAIGTLTIGFWLLYGAMELGLETLVSATSMMPGFDLVSWGNWNFYVLVLGVVIIGLAEVFRYGRQLQSDVDLTV